jgi:hypothetical protein
MGMAPCVLAWALGGTTVLCITPPASAGHHVPQERGSASHAASSLAAEAACREPGPPRCWCVLQILLVCDALACAAYEITIVRSGACSCTGEEPLPEEDPNLFKPLPEPSLVDSFLVASQISTYSDQLNAASLSTIEKLYVMESLQRSLQ